MIIFVFFLTAQPLIVYRPGLHSPFYFLIGQNLFITTKIPNILLLVYGMVVLIEQPPNNDAAPYNLLAQRAAPISICFLNKLSLANQENLTRG